MIPVGASPDKNSADCRDITAKCVIWDGPNIDIKCLGVQIYKGDSITPIVYNSFKNLCILLEKTDISDLNPECFSGFISESSSLVDVFNVISNKLCSENLQINNLEVTYDDATRADLPYCLQEITDTLTITKAPLPELYQKVALKICLYLTDLSLLTTAINLADSQTNSTSLLHAEIYALCNAVTALVTPTCTNNSVENPSGDPVKVEIAYDWLEKAFCSFKNFTGSTTELSVAIAKDCPNIDTLPRLSNGGLMNQIYGWVDNPTNVSNSVGNLWLTICDLRSAIRNLQIGCCVDSPCASFNVGYTLEFDPNNTYLDVVFDSCTIKSLDRLSTFTSVSGAAPSWIGVDFPTIGTVSITLNDGNGDETQDTGLTLVDLMQGPAYPTGNYYRFVYPSTYDPTAPVKSITISFTYKWIGTTYPISNAVYTGSNTTYTIPSGHLITPGEYVSITGITPSGFNATNVKVLGVTTNSFTIHTVTPGLTYTSDGIVSLYDPACDLCDCCCTFTLTNGIY